MCYAVKQCKRKFAEAARTEPGPVTYGNTNTIVEHYGEALGVAYNTNRLVSFVRHGSELPRLGVELLYRRNLRRFASSGKYIPLGTLKRKLEESDRILLEPCVVDEKGIGSGGISYARTARTTRTSEDLCEIAGFRLNPATNLVTPIPIRPVSPQK